MSKMNVMKNIQEMKGKINPNYDMSIENIQTLVNNSDEGFDLVSNAFTFGYIQGMKAQKAKDRKKKAWSYLFYSLVGARLWKEYANTSIWLLNYQKRKKLPKKETSHIKETSHKERIIT